jgi:putative FmdB family regulatory protein
MPLFRYRPARVPCKLCGAGFEQRQSASDPALASCPTCGQPVSREATHQVNSPKILAPLSISSAKQAGFTVLKRTAKGEFERQ